MVRKLRCVQSSDSQPFDKSDSTHATWAQASSKLNLGEELQVYVPKYLRW